MTLIDFCVDLLDGLLSDVEGRIEVTVTDDNVFLGAVELVVPGTCRTEPIRDNWYGVRCDYRALDTDDEDQAYIDRLIRRALAADEHWMQSAYQQARRAA